MPDKSGTASHFSIAKSFEISSNDYKNEGTPAREFPITVPGRGRDAENVGFAFSAKPGNCGEAGALFSTEWQGFGTEMNENDLSAAAIWETAAARLLKRNHFLYDQWFKKMLPLSVDGAELTLGVTDIFFADIVREQYDDILSEALVDIGGKTYSWKLE